ncbi:MAG: hypothetical protein D6719_13650 [Candidatus Dadabacteria bacterium]|nr:MAG: hypothetical protein D6719_13650 [Candidatus Dadabacteria bacterium]
MEVQLDNLSKIALIFALILTLPAGAYSQSVDAGKHVFRYGHEESDGEDRFSDDDGHRKRFSDDDGRKRVTRRPGGRRGGLRKKKRRACRRIERRASQGLGISPSTKDIEGDGLTNRFESRIRTNPRKPDTDSDGLSDSKEVCNTKTDPNNPDTDGDGIPDGQDSTPRGSGGSGGTCSSNGNTNAFGIPSGVTGNTGRGRQAYSSTCSACHSGIEKGKGYPYSNLKRAVEGPPMFLSLSRQTLADLTAFLNRSKCRSKTPAPRRTPAPNNPGTSGRAVFSSRCQGCHGNPSIFRGLSRSRLDAAIANIPPMRGIRLSQQEYQALFSYFGSL